MTTPASEIDVSPMIFTEFVSEGRRYRTDRPLVFKFEYVEEDGVGLYLYEGEYNIMHGAETREECWDLIDDTLGFLWRELAEGNQDRMDGVAIERGAELRARFQLVTDAA